MVEFDPEAPATYVRLRDGAAAKTIEVVDAYCMVDLSVAGEPLGIEILDAPADITSSVLQALAASFPDLDVTALQVALSGHAIVAA